MLAKLVLAYIGSAWEQLHMTAETYMIGFLFIDKCNLL
jgi:hypothetical protein